MINFNLKIGFIWTWISALCLSCAYSQSVSGIIFSAKDGSAVPFATVYALKSKVGQISDLDGRFRLDLNQVLDTLKVTALGYESQYVAINKTEDDLKIYLEPKEVEIEEIIIRSDENPAHRIIRLAIHNKKSNNPEHYPEFSYYSYNKTRLYPQKSSSYFNKKNDKTVRRVDSVFNTMDMIVWETVTRRNYKYFKKSKEIVIGSKLSGLPGIAIPFSPTDLQDLSFYNDRISILSSSFVSPLTDNAIEKYDFELLEVLINPEDSIFTIAFKPQSQYVNGLKGQMRISSIGYAIQSIHAKVELPPDGLAFKDIEISQIYEYQKNGQKWFPAQLNTDLVFPVKVENRDSIKNETLPLILTVRSYIKNIDLFPMLSNSDFDALVIEVKPDAGKKPESFWAQYRNDSLTSKEIQTYKIVDSLGKKAKLDKMYLALNILATGHVRIKYFDFDITKIYQYNPVEKNRFGLGVRTNELISPKFTLKSWFGYGTEDKLWKYSVGTEIHPFKNKKYRLHYDYSYDLIPIGTNFLGQERLVQIERKQQDVFSIRNFFYTWRDYTTRHSCFVMLPFFKYAAHSFGFQAENRVHAFNKESSNDFKELIYFFRLSYREELVSNGIITYNKGTRFPIVEFRATSGFHQNSNYSKLEASITHKLFTDAPLQLSYQLNLGVMSSNIPFSKRYFFFANGAPSYFGLTNSFNTMYFGGMPLFSADRYVVFHCRAEHKNAVFPTKKYNPDLFWAINAGWGQGKKLNFQETMPSFIIPELGYHEAGVGINHILPPSVIEQFPSLRFIGFSAFLRFGAYATPKIEENIVLKIEYTLLLN